MSSVCCRQEAKSTEPMRFRRRPLQCSVSTAAMYHRSTGGIKALLVNPSPQLQVLAFEHTRQLHSIMPIQHNPSLQDCSDSSLEDEATGWLRCCCGASAAIAWKMMFRCCLEKDEFCAKEKTGAVTFRPGRAGWLEDRAPTLRPCLSSRE